MLIERFRGYIKENCLFEKTDRLIVAVSGGLDSSLLCALLKESGYAFEMAHCNFKLRGAESDRDEQFAKSLSLKYDVPFFVRTFDTKKTATENKTGLEETARDLRYNWFNELRAEGSSQNSFILTAHHADDNIETVMMNFFRGTGVKGLRGIQNKQNHICRPLLFARRNEIELWAAENKIDFVQDSSNAENDFTRNQFRNLIIPAIQNIYPQVPENILSNIRRMEEVEMIFDEAISKTINKIITVKGADKYIPVMRLLQLPYRTTLFHEILHPAGFTSGQVHEAEKLLKAESGKYITSSTHRLLKDRKMLILSPISNNASEIVVIENIEANGIKSIFNFAHGTVEMSIKNAERLDEDPHVAMIDMAEIEFPLLLRKWKQGDYFYPLGMKKKKKLSRFLSDNKLSLAAKEKVWVVESNKRIIWIAGMRIDDRFKMTANTKRILHMRLRPSE